MRVVADTNVIISMLLWGKTLERLFVMVNQRQITLCFSPETIDELFKVVYYPKIQKQTTRLKIPVESLIDKLMAASVICHPDDIIKAVPDDESDNRILETAIAANAEYIISGDRHLLTLKIFKNIPIYSPSEFLDIFSYGTTG